MSGYVDPSIVPTTRVEREILAAIIAQRLTLRRDRPGGNTMRLTGPDVDMLTTRIAYLRTEVLGSRAERGRR